jgi:hypothetical protein
VLKAKAPFCPLCLSITRIRETTLASNGTRRRRFCCQDPDCGHRWTEWDGVRIKPGGQPGHRPARQRTEPLSEEAIRLLLTRRDLNHTRASKVVDATPEAVRLIRFGKLRKSSCPDLPRWGDLDALTCRRCRHWSGNKCFMGLPDPLEEGISFAAECCLFSEASPGC